jgi:hypothetical protein
MFEFFGCGSGVGGMHLFGVYTIGSSAWNRLVDVSMLRSS